jgi:hypothetical protein
VTKGGSNTGPGASKRRRGGVLNYMMAVEQVAADPRRAGNPHQAGYGDLETAVARVPVGQPADRWVGGNAAASGEESGSDRSRHLVVTGLIVLLAMLIAVPLLLAALRPTGPMSLPLPPGAVPTPSGTRPGAASPGQPEAVPVPTPAATPSSASPGPSASGVSGRPAASTRGPSVSVPSRLTALTARYSTVGHTGLLGLSGYQGRVVVSNPGTAAVTGWQVTLSLPAGETATRVSGANAKQSGSTVTFTPQKSATVATGSSVTFTFQVSGVLGGPPTGCAIDGRPCS